MPATPTIPPMSPGAACYARGTPPRPSPAPPTCSPDSAASSSPPDFRPYGQARPHPDKSPTTPGPATPSPPNSETRGLRAYREIPAGYDHDPVELRRVAALAWALGDVRHIHTTFRSEEH